MIKICFKPFTREIMFIMKAKSANTKLASLRPALLLLCGLSLAGCFGEQAKIEESFETAPKSNGSTVNGICYSDQYTPEGNIIRKLDIVVVPDTSASIIEERGAIADGFDAFLNSLPSEVDYQVGVVLGHSDKTSWAGKLYQKGTEPLVLDSKALPTGDIVAYLNQKLQNPSGDNYSDGGEMGLSSLLKALTENKAQIQGEGFFREDAALAVVFVADEQDICAEYPEGVAPVPDPQGGEDRSKAEFCLDENGEYIITPQIVFDAIKEHQGERPFVIGGVIYNNAATVPMSGENEIGYGYKETVELAGGITVDLASGDYGDGLTRLGKMAQVAVKPENEFNLKTNKVDPSTIEVFVDGQSVGFSYISETNQVKLDQERGPFSVANVKYCEKEEKPMIAKKVTAGAFHSCAILLDGKLKCWGSNNYGQLGLGHTENIGDNEAPSSVAALDFGQKVEDVSAGAYHTCAVLEDGSVKCWGQNNFGQLGIGSNENLGDDEKSTEIAAIPLARPAKRIYSGTYYNCALLDNKKIQCWGDNTYGQLGYGDKNHRGDDETLDGLPYVSVGGSVVQMDISTISSHTCAALDTGDLKCWGQNSLGQLGYGHKNEVTDPSVLDSVPFGNKVLQIATGNSHTCALAGGQKVRCWGANSSGQTGLGSGETIGDDEAANSVDYLDLAGDGSLLFNMVATGNLHTCAIDIGNSVYCWGAGNMGATGLASASNLGDDEPVTAQDSKVDLGMPVTQVTAGALHTCALTKEEGKVICWGQNSFGQLGLGHTIMIGDNESPSEVVELEPGQE